ncbi:hypothetical protein Sgleb_29380 [Streptomyces glebosus]|uniref:Uncharacterized protein n=1 Tax=Streptomyces glebosus TaxID=249580 RepID=A0A640SXA9_9ACTN|nr:hypothetical protein [Streptomyces glebosus]GFE14891.1 hypothetical protein Sgleb_29380 [Streptomyces glebosus]GHG62036.1 hypothetical protein GCM10010513_28750 [Streptomyces glebosus]
MKRHPFEPARLISGLTALTLGTAYGLDALGLWHAPGPWLFLTLPAGLLLSGITAAVWTRTRRPHHPHTDSTSSKGS